jgi:hypothetical protein
MEAAMERVAPEHTGKRAYRIHELKALGGPGRDRAYKLIGQGKLIAHKDGRNTIIFAENLDRYFASLPKVEPKVEPKADKPEPDKDEARERGQHSRRRRRRPKPI